MSKEFKVYGDIIQEYYIVVTAEDSDEAWHTAVATPKNEWVHVAAKKDSIEPYQVEELTTK
jgi:hypothetical protein